MPAWRDWGLGLEERLRGRSTVPARVAMGVRLRGRGSAGEVSCGVIRGEWDVRLPNLRPWARET
jgi:hypothetical protein